MAVKGLEQTRTKLDSVKRFGGWVLAAIIVAVIFVGILMITGLMNFIPRLNVRVFGIVLPQEWVMFIVAFTFAITVILSWVYFIALIKQTLKKVHRKWMDLPDWAQAVFLAIQGAFIAGMCVYLTHIFYFQFDLLVMIAPAILTFVAIYVLTTRLREQGWTIMEWTRSLYTSALVGAVVAILATLAFAEVAPGYMPPAVFFAFWAVGIYLFYRRRESMDDDFITNILTKTGYAQMRQVDTFSVSILSGLGLAVIVALLVGLFGTTPSNMVTRALLAAVIVWPVVTLGTSLGWPSRDRHGLVIDDINVRKSTELRELTVRNIGDAPVSIHNAKLQDAHNKLYHIGIRATLSSGESGKFELPPDFELAAHDHYKMYDLPFGLRVMREASHPMIVTRDGKKFVLRWIDQVREMRQAKAKAEAGTPAAGS